jgi:hypothetical protein
MEKDDLIQDEMLGRLIRKTDLESPSDAFVGKVMAGIRPETVMAPARKPFYLFVKSSWLWVLLGAFVAVILFAPDIPYLNLGPGKSFFSTAILPGFEFSSAGLRNLYPGSKAISLTLLLVFAGGILYALDLLLNRKFSVKHHTA